MPSARPVIVAARRTAIGTAGSAFADVDAIGLAAPLLTEARLAPAVDGPVDEVILGNCLGPGGNIARVAALAAGFDPQVPGVTVDRQCGSGLESVGQAAALIGSGAAGLVLAGGVESASTAPWRFWPPATADDQPRRYTRAPFAPDGFDDPSMGAAADALAARLGIGRADQDRYAERSHRLTFEAVTSGAFADEILDVAGVSVDQRPRPGLTATRLAALRPAFDPGGTVTAGNSCGISDGAALLTVAADPAGTAGLLIRAVATVGGDPALPGLSAAPAIRKAVARSGIELTDVGAVEITEAFAGIALATIAGTGLPEEIVCTQGGAIGYGHPWGASGAVLLVRLFSRMVRADGPEFGVAACAIGGGLGIAAVVQRVG